MTDEEREIEKVIFLQLMRVMRNDLNDFFTTTLNEQRTCLDIQFIEYLRTVKEVLMLSTNSLMSMSEHRRMIHICCSAIAHIRENASCNVTKQRLSDLLSLSDIVRLAY